jgi:hypothetical protein
MEPLAMRVHLESTTQVVTIVVNGVELPGRVWEGRTDSGIQVVAIITRIAAPIDADLAQFSAELQACRPPVMPAAWPNRLIL